MWNRIPVCFYSRWRGAYLRIIYHINDPHVPSAVVAPVIHQIFIYTHTHTHTHTHTGIYFWIFSSFFFKFIYLEREREREGEGQKERETESQVGSALFVQSPTQSLNPRTVRSCPELKPRTRRLPDWATQVPLDPLFCFIATSAVIALSLPWSVSSIWS